VSEHLDANRRHWDERAPAHAVSPGYSVDRFVADPTHLSDVVRFDVERLGDIAGRRGVHLQCHIGTDTISLARLGARMTGLDFSAPALAVARQLAADCGAAIAYVESDVYGAVEALGAGRFDLVYTGMGALCWLPDVRRWAEVVGRLLRPGGRLFLREGHPMLWSLSQPRPDGLVVVEHPYFETAEGTRFVETKSYVEHEGELAAPESVEFNHGMGEVVTALLSAGLALTALEEHDSVPWDFLAGATVRDDRGEWRLGHSPERLAASYTLQAVKR
jgi:SAM-dependent methyltransferase